MPKMGGVVTQSQRVGTAPVFSDEEFLAAIDAHQHADDVMHAPAARAAAGIGIDGIRQPAL